MEKSAPPSPNAGTPTTVNVDEATGKVVEMYSKYPFPFHGNHGNYFEQTLLQPLKELGREYPIRRLLDAGCGTGNITADIATLLPEIQITAIDLTDESLSLAKKRAAEHGFKNVAFRKSNLMEYDRELGVFDFVYSQGVIHHLSDPLTGMKNLNRYLKQDHYAFVWLYSLLGRRDLLEMREALKILGVDQLPWEQRVQLAKDTRPLFMGARSTFLRKLIKVLDYLDRYKFKGFGHFLAEYFRRSSRERYDDIVLADQILHPQDKFYRFAEAVEMFNQAGFKFVKVLQGMSNTLEESFGPQAKRILSKKVSMLDSYNLIELHEKPLGTGYLIKKTRELS
jgi:ubiquinone/menaquinone biosynthesis C-methylase UbiE